MRLALAQINTRRRRLEGNSDADPRAPRRGARDAGADLVLFPELALTRYPPEDLLLRPGSFAPPRRSSASSRQRPPDGVALVGAPHLDGDLYNACLRSSPAASSRRLPQALPPQLRRLRREPVLRLRPQDLSSSRFGELLVGPTICEDIWQPGPPATDLALAGAQLVVNISASPFHVGKAREREEMIRVRARDNSCFVALCNAVGGQDELVFDGASRRPRRRGRADRARAELRGGAAGRRPRPGLDGRPPAARRAPPRARARARRRRRTTELVSFAAPRRAQTVHAAPAAGAAARASSSRCASRSSSGCATTSARTASTMCVLGVSGGIDSALTAALCGRGARPRARPRRLDAVALLLGRRPAPTPQRLAGALGIDLPRDPDRADRRGLQPRRSRRRSRAASRPDRGEPAGAGPRHAADGALEQVRLALIATGNKSELSVGYSTLYGDLAGGFALLKDVYKTDVFRLAAAAERAGRAGADPAVRSSSGPARPNCAPTSSTRTRCPPTASSTASSRPTSRTTARARSCTEDGFDPAVVERAVAMIDRAEYKRRQAPPGVKIHPKAFGRDRRTPITNRWPGLSQARSASTAPRIGTVIVSARLVQPTTTSAGRVRWGRPSRISACRRGP